MLHGVAQDAHGREAVKISGAGKGVVRQLRFYAAAIRDQRVYAVYHHGAECALGNSGLKLLQTTVFTGALQVRERRLQLIRQKLIGDPVNELTEVQTVYLRIIQKEAVGQSRTDKVLLLLCQFPGRKLLILLLHVSR